MALISADKANIELTFERAASIDLAGRDVLDAVKVSVNPKVINTPLIAAIAKDGIQVKATCRVDRARQYRPLGPVVPARRRSSPGSAKGSLPPSVSAFDAQRGA